MISTKRMEIFYVFISLVMHCEIYLAVNLNTLSTFEKNQTGVLVCDVPSFTASVEITNSRNPGVLLSSCNPVFCSPGNSGRYTYSSNASAVSVTISLSTQADDEAIWTCTLTTASPESDTYELTISSRPATTEFTSINPSNGSDIDKVTLSATSYCFYPQIRTVSLLYRIGTSGAFLMLNPPVSVSSSSGSSKGCDAYEFKIDVSGLEISSNAYPVLSKQSNVYLTIIFDHPVLGNFTPTNGPVGPYDFLESSSDGCNCDSIRVEKTFCILLESLIILVLGIILNVCGKCLNMKCIQKSAWATCIKSRWSYLLPLCADKNSPDCSGTANSMNGIQRFGVLLLFSFTGFVFGIPIGLAATGDKCCNCDRCEPDTALCFGLGSFLGFLLFLIYMFCIFPVCPISKWPDEISYKVLLKTGTKSLSEKKKNIVYLKMFGSKGNTEYLTLINSISFKKNSTYLFTVDADDIGKISQISIGHKEAIDISSFIDEVHIEISSTGDLYVFVCKCNPTETDRETVIKPANMFLSGAETSYKVSLKTGSISQPQADTADTFVYLKMFGKKGNSGCILLDSYKKFKKNHAHHFIFVGNDVGKIIQIRTGLNGTNTELSMFIDEVCIENSRRELYMFTCHSELKKNGKDAEIEIKLTSTEKISYNVSLKTGNMTRAETDAIVYLKLIGSKCNTGCLPLDNYMKFEKNHKHHFIVEADDVGKIMQIRAGLHEPNTELSMFIHEVFIENSRKELYIFTCHSELKKNEKDAEIEIKLTSTEPKISYNVSLKTGNMTQAKTDAIVYLTMFGSKRNTGCLPLDNYMKFEKNHKHHFIVEADDVGKITQIRISLDGTKEEMALFLEEVEISSGEFYSFTCHYMLKNNGTDGEMQIYPSLTKQYFSKSFTSTKTSYNVTLKTGSMFPARPDDSMYLKMFGSKGNSGYLPLHNSNEFKENHTYHFSFEQYDIGQIKHIRICFLGAKEESAFFLDELCIEVPCTGELYLFACHCELKKNEGVCEKEIQCTNTKQRTSYNVFLKTGSVSQEIRNVKINLKMFGSKGDSEWLHFLCSSIFKEKHTYRFIVVASDIGQIRHIRIDGTEEKSALCLDEIHIEIPSAGVYVFKCGQIGEELQLARNVKMKSGTLYNVCLMTSKSSGADSCVPLEVSGSTGKFECLAFSSDKSGPFTCSKRHTDHFTVLAQDIGKLTELLQTDSSIWKLHEVHIKVPSKGEEYVFSYELPQIQRQVEEKIELKPIESRSQNKHRVEATCAPCLLSKSLYCRVSPSENQRSEEVAIPIEESHKHGNLPALTGTEITKQNKRPLPLPPIKKEAAEGKGQVRGFQTGEH